MKAVIKDKWFVLVTIATIILIFGSWILYYHLLSGLPDNKKSAFGDMFGGLNSLFSGLALAGIILTIVLQKKELSLQRQELISTKKELKRTADSQEKSEIALNRQAENLKISAKLSALNSLLNFYSEQEESILKALVDHNDLSKFRLKKENCVRKIEEILEHEEQ